MHNCLSFEVGAAAARAGSTLVRNRRLEEEEDLVDVETKTRNLASSSVLPFLGLNSIAVGPDKPGGGRAATAFSWIAAKRLSIDFAPRKVFTK